MCIRDRFSYVWKKGTTIISGATANSYTITSVAAADAATYTVEVTGACGPMVSSSADLTVNVNASTSALSPLTKCPGESATFSTTASGTGPFSYCLLYTSDAADDLTRVDLGGRRIIKKKK